MTAAPNSDEEDCVSALSNDANRDYIATDLNTQFDDTNQNGSLWSDHMS